MGLKKGILPDLTKVTHKKEPEKVIEEPKEPETDINGMRYHQTFLPKTEMKEDGTPVMNIPDVDDMNISLSASSVLRKDMERQDARLKERLGTGSLTDKERNKL